MNNNNELESKYIEERIAILKQLHKTYGENILDIAFKEKAQLETERILTKYKEEIPVDIDKYYKYAFNDFEGIEALLDLEIVKKTKDELIVKVSKCAYKNIYSKYNGEEIGKRLVCNMDQVITKALNKDFILERPKRMMDGDEYCIFHIKTLKNKSAL